MTATRVARLASFFLLLPAVVFAAPRTKVAVPPATGTAADKETANTLAELVAAEIGKDPRISVTTSSDIAALLGVEAQRQLLDCDAGSSSCLADIGGALGVDFVIAMQVGRLESARLVTGSLVATKGGRSVTRIVERVDERTPIDQAAVRLAAQLRDALVAEHVKLHPEAASSGSVAFPVTLVASAVVALAGAAAVTTAWMAHAEHVSGAANGAPTLTWPEAQSVTTQAGIGWGGVGVGLAGVGVAFVFFGPGGGSAGDAVVESP